MPSSPPFAFNHGGGGPYQVVVGGVGVILGEGDVDPQRHTVGKDGGEDEDVEGPGGGGGQKRGGQRVVVGFRPPVFPITTPNPCPPTPKQNLLPLHDADGRSADGVVEAEAEEGAGGTMDPPGPLSLVFGVGGAAVPLPRGGPTIRYPPVAFSS